jgi:hypothetical protein
MTSRAKRTLTTTLLWSAALVALAATSACGRKEAAQPKPASTAAVSQPVSSEAPPPLTFQQKSQQANVALTLPAEVQRAPVLHRRLYAAEVKDLKSFADNAKAEFAEMGDAGAGALPSEKREDWSVADETAKLLSLRSLTYEFETGGAHPNLVYGAILWDKALQRPVTLTSLFRTDADLGPVEAALCAGIRTESKARFGAVRASDDAGPNCPRLQDTPFTLAPSTTPGKVGGLTFLISPGSLGSMSEGPYEVTVPFPVFAKLLAPAYADDFAGTPAKPKPKAA